MKVGEYGRTEEGKIIKIEELEDIYTGLNEFITTIAYFKGGYISVEHIIKSSPNIIDLIEVGDIVNYEQLNGGVVLNKKDDSIDTWSILPNSLKNEDIKSVITKEQLKNCMYEVGD